MYVIQRKKGTMISIGVSVKNYMIGVLVEKSYMWNPSACSACDCEYKNACKIREYLDIKNCSYKKRLFGKSVLACGNEILKRDVTSVVDKKK